MRASARRRLLSAVQLQARDVYGAGCDSEPQCLLADRNGVGAEQRPDRRRVLLKTDELIDRLALKSQHPRIGAGSRSEPGKRVVFTIGYRPLGARGTAEGARGGEQLRGLAVRFGTGFRVRVRVSIPAAEGQLWRGAGVQGFARHGERLAV